MDLSTTSQQGSCSSQPNASSSQSRANEKKSWPELKDIVTEMRRQFMSLSSMVPTSISFRRLTDGRIRIYFLSTPQNGYESTLLYSDVHTDPPAGPPLLSVLNPVQPPVAGSPPTSSNPSMISSGSSHSSGHLPNPTTDACGQKVPHKLQWNQVLEPSISSLNNNNAPSSREVQLMLERKRLSTWGITSYELHKNSGKIVYPASSTLFQCLDTGFAVSYYLSIHYLITELILYY